MPEYFKGVLAVALAAMAGCLLLRTIDPQSWRRPVAALAIAYGLGMGVITWVMQILSFARIKFTPISILVSLGFVALMLILAGLRKSLGRDLPRPHPMTDAFIQSRSSSKHIWVEGMLTFLIAAQVVLTIVLTLFTPTEAYDAVAIWGLKAKAIFTAQGIPTEFLLDQNYRSYAYHPDYPLLVPLAQSYCCFLSGRFDEYVSKLIFPGFFLGCLVSMGIAGEKYGLSRSERLGLMFMLVAVPFYNSQATTGYADFVLAYYFGTGTLFLYWWVRDERLADLVVSSLLLGFAGMTKNEGLALGLVSWVVMIIFTIRDSKRSSIKARWLLCGLYFLIQFVVQLPWLIYRAYFHLSNDVVNQNALIASLHWSTVKRLGPIFYQYQTQIFGVRNWNIVWITLLVVLALRGKAIMKADSRYLLFPILSCILIYTIIYLITPRDVVWHLKTSVSRVFLHFLPVTLLLIARVYAGEKYQEA